MTVKKYLKLLSCNTEEDLDKIISTLSEDDAKSFVKMVILYLQENKIQFNIFDSSDIQ